MHTREVPGWAEKVPATDTRRVVTCGGCGKRMPWRTFVHLHGPTCEGPDETEKGTRAHDTGA